MSHASLVDIRDMQISYQQLMSYGDPSPPRLQPPIIPIVTPTTLRMTDRMAEAAKGNETSRHIEQYIRDCDALAAINARQDHKKLPGTPRVNSDTREKELFKIEVALLRRIHKVSLELFKVGNVIESIK